MEVEITFGDQVDPLGDQVDLLGDQVDLLGDQVDPRGVPEDHTAGSGHQDQLRQDLLLTRCSIWKLLNQDFVHAAIQLNIN